MKACMGGLCRIRERCQHYNAHDRREPAERLCVPGRDGVKRAGAVPVVATAQGQGARMNLTDQIIQITSTPDGATLGQIKTATGRSDATIGVMVSAIAKTGRLVGVGVHGRRRYFSNPENAAASEARIEQDDEAHKLAVAARQEQRREHRNAVRRAATAARRIEREKTKPPKPKKAKKAERPFAKLIVGNAPVYVPAPKKPVEIITPPGLEVQRAPGYTHDTRFQLPPGERVMGGFLTMGVGRYLEVA